MDGGGGGWTDGTDGVFMAWAGLKHTKLLRGKHNETYGREQHGGVDILIWKRIYPLVADGNWVAVLLGRVLLLFFFLSYVL